MASTHSLYQKFEFLYDDARAIDQGADLIKSVNGEAKDSRAACNLVGIVRDVADQMKVLTGLAEESKLRLGSRFRNRASLIILKEDMIRKHGAVVYGVSKLRTALFHFLIPNLVSAYCSPYSKV